MGTPSWSALRAAMLAIFCEATENQALNPRAKGGSKTVGGVVGLQELRLLGEPSRSFTGEITTVGFTLRSETNAVTSILPKPPTLP